LCNILDNFGKANEIASESLAGPGLIKLRQTSHRTTLSNDAAQIFSNKNNIYSRAAGPEQTEAKT